MTQQWQTAQEMRHEGSLINKETAALIKKTFLFCLKSEQEVFMQNFDGMNFLRVNGFDVNDETLQYVYDLYTDTK